MGRVTHFEINADNAERAIRFYRNVFGWKIERWSGPTDYWLVTTGDGNEAGIDGAIMPRTAPAAAFINTIEVDSLDEAIDGIKSNGGKVLGDKMSIPGVGYFTYCTDTEGNQFGLIQNKE
jgi:uncharacterized protein